TPCARKCSGHPHEERLSSVKSGRNAFFWRGLAFSGREISGSDATNASCFSRLFEKCRRNPSNAAASPGARLLSGGITESIFAWPGISWAVCRIQFPQSKYKERRRGFPVSPRPPRRTLRQVSIVRDNDAGWHQ